MDKKESVFMQMHNGTRTGEGSFNEGLQKLFYLAGTGNRHKLVKAFPEFFGTEVPEFNIFPGGNFGDDIEKIHQLPYKDRQPVANEIFYALIKSGQTPEGARHAMRGCGISRALVTRCTPHAHSQYSPETPAQKRPVHSCNVAG